MKNYIEIEHRYEEPGPDGDIAVDTWWAVRPTPFKWFDKDEPEKEVESLYKGHNEPEKEVASLYSGHMEPWRIEALQIYNTDDIAGVRKLLDAIEKEFDSE